MKSKLGYFSDNLLCVFIVFITSFVWTRHYVHNKTLIVVITLVLTLIFSAIILIYARKRRNKDMLSVTEKQNIQKFYDYFLFCNQQNYIDYFLKTLNNVVSEKNNLYIYYENTKYLFVPFFKESEITRQFYIDLVKTFDDKNIFVLSDNEGISASQLRKSLSNNIVFMSISEFYKKYLVNVSVPQNNFIIKPQKRNLSTIFQTMFNKKQAKKYLSLCVFFTCYAFILRYNLYYLFFSLLCAIFCIYSIKNTRFNCNYTKF